LQPKAQVFVHYCTFVPPENSFNAAILEVTYYLDTLKSISEETSDIQK
jgi:hypothetical protein